MKTKVFLWSLLALVLLFLPEGVKAGVNEINAAQLKGMMDADSVQVIFPLSRIEFNDLHIAGSVHLPMDRIPAQLPPDKERKLAFYCLGRS